jgi:hypothetical protein
MRDLVKNAVAGDHFVFHCKYGVRGLENRALYVYLRKQFQVTEARCLTRILRRTRRRMAWTKVRLQRSSFRNSTEFIISAIWPADIELDTITGDGMYKNMIIDDVFHSANHEIFSC